MRELDNLNKEQAEKNGWKILKPFDCEVVGKAVYEEGGLRIMKSTKRFKVNRGWIYNTSTEIHKSDVVTVAEALCFVPE